MNRLLMIGSLALMLVGTTGCLHHNTRGGSSCSTGNCGTGNCNTGNCGTGNCNTGNCQTGDCYGSGGYGDCQGGGLCGTKCGSCNTCQSAPQAYGNGGKCVGNGCNCNGCGSGLLGRIGGAAGVCKNTGCRPGCVPGRIGWQQGGLDYSAHLQPGCLGHHAGDALNSRPFTPGPPTAAVAYPYYTHRGPRDFLMDNPPSIGR